MKHNQSLLRLAAIALLAIATFIWACSDDFLEIEPTGQLTNEVLSSKAGIEGSLVGAYSMLLGRGGFYAGPTNWMHGSVRGAEANKGSESGDQNVANPIQRYETEPTSGDVINQLWLTMYEGISRSNATLRLLEVSEDPNLTDDDRTRIRGEAIFLRGHYYFQLRRAFNMVPYFDETIADVDVPTVPNNRDIWEFIIADFQEAFNLLPEVQIASGRANKWAAAAYLGKTYLYTQDWQNAKTIFDQVVASGVTADGDPYCLLDSYEDLFNPAFDNSCESVFAVQAAVNTGSINNANPELVLNFPHNPNPPGPGGCCGFFQPSFDQVNAYRTENGLPLLDYSYRDDANELENDMGLEASAPFTPSNKPVDPRLDHTVGRRGIPYLDWGIHPGRAWIRFQPNGGPYTPKKYTYYKAQQDQYTDGSSWTRGYTATNYMIIRYADVLLMLAEAEIELNNLDRGRELINQVRARAADPATWVKLDNGNNAANYQISEYASFASQDEARQAVRFERRLELGMEGHRFFDLVRWGIAAPELNAYLNYERQYLPIPFEGAQFTSNQDEYYPIPQAQVDIQGEDVLTQNPGY